MSLDLFTKFDGRINRQRFWLGLIVLIVVHIVVGILLALIADGQLLALLGLVLSLVLLYPGLALAIKRLHDRNKSATPWVYIFYGPGLLLLIMQTFGIGYSLQTLDGTPQMLPETFGWIVMAISVIVGIWALIELGFLKGTTGPNHFGPDPLQ